MSSPSDAWHAWRSARLEAVTSVPGNLALVSYQPVGAAPEPIEGVPDATVRRAEGKEGVLVTAPSALGMRVDGAPIDGETFVPRLGADGTPVVRCGHLSFDVFSLDGTDHELRVYDDRSENLRLFAGIDAYDHDPSLAVEGVFTAYDATDQVAWDFTRAQDSGHTKKVPGTITLHLGGEPRELLAFLDGNDLVLVFADATTGRETYAPGRFLRIPRPEADGAVTVDFNRAFVPPCGFSDFYSCPIPPPQNRLPVPVRAGEKRALWK
ncbi:DUF1684 domain-containing protein [Spirillospora sp. CA-294931]|uniref:DUF1684 domain-containing protein n=1 Tax=Spirillospora sp. CA-294931 TaxID=3240042 RepID=UPI003D8E86B9